MADQCQHAIPALGGHARQCPKDATTGLNVLAADKPAPEALAVCDDHYMLLSQRREGSAYRADQSQPIRIFVTT